VQGRLEVVRLLLDAGADPARRNRALHSPADTAAAAAAAAARAQRQRGKGNGFKGAAGRAELDEDSCGDADQDFQAAASLLAGVAAGAGGMGGAVRDAMARDAARVAFVAEVRPRAQHSAAPGLPRAPRARPAAHTRVRGGGRLRGAPRQRTWWRTLRPRARAMRCSHRPHQARARPPAAAFCKVEPLCKVNVVPGVNCCVLCRFPSAHAPYARPRRADEPDRAHGGYGWVLLGDAEGVARACAMKGTVLFGRRIDVRPHQRRDAVAGGSHAREHTPQRA